MLKTYKELTAWQKAYDLCLVIYRISKDIPKEEQCGLISQLRRAALSIPSNIAEGYGRKSIGDYLRFLYISYGSVCELETQILISKDLGYISMECFQETNDKISEVERILKGLIKSLEKKHSNP